MDQTLTCYFAAWNETDAGERGRLLQRSLSDDAELVDPTGRWRVVGGFSDRIQGDSAKYFPPHRGRPLGRPFKPRLPPSPSIRAFCGQRGTPSGLCGFP
jgi:hypothetical protein